MQAWAHTMQGLLESTTVPGLPGDRAALCSSKLPAAGLPGLAGTLPASPRGIWFSRGDLPTGESKSFDSFPNVKGFHKASSRKAEEDF